jgi:hypothetical protein
MIHRGKDWFLGFVVNQNQNPMAKKRKFSAKQLAAQRKFAAMARARAKAAKKKAGNPTKRGTRSLYRYAKRVSTDQGKSRESKLRSLARTGVSRTRALKKRAQNKTIIKARTIKHLDVSKVHNPRKRIKVRNKYVDLVIKGQAKLTPQGWKIGGKTFAQGRGTVALTKKGFYLDRATGAVYAKRERNSDKRDSDHPIEVTRHWRAGPPGYLTPWQRAHAAGQKQLFDTGIKPAKRRNPKSKKRTRRNPSVQSIREKFSGQKARKITSMVAPSGTPIKLAKLGKLVSITTNKARLDLAKKNPQGSDVWLCSDERGKLHIATSGEPVTTLHNANLGTIEEIEYREAKPHLGYPKQTIFFHELGEDSGIKPTLHADGEGFLKVRGGNYKVTAAGIVD